MKKAKGKDTKIINLFIKEKLETKKIMLKSFQHKKKVW